MNDEQPTSEPSADASTADLQAFDEIQSRCDTLRQTLSQVIVGQQKVIEPLLVAMLCQGHTLIVGVPGLAKTLLVRTLAQAVDLSFRRIQFTPDMMPADILGTEIIQEDVATGRRDLRFVPGPVFAQLILADEINRTPPRTQAALLEAMAERQVTTAGRTMPLQTPFIVVATQNPIEQEGTYPLPEAQLDRFMFSLWMDYPSRAEEASIVAERRRINRQKVSQVFSHEALSRAAELIEQMPVSQHVIDYAVELVRHTRPGRRGAEGAAADASGKGAKQDGKKSQDSAPSGAWAVADRFIAWGAGPRAGQALIHAAQALAAIQGQPTPGCDHVKQIAPWVLRHRIVVNYNATGQHITSGDIVQMLLEDVQPPRY